MSTSAKKIKDGKNKQTFANNFVKLNKKEIRERFHENGEREWLM